MTGYDTHIFAFRGACAAIMAPSRLRFASVRGSAFFEFRFSFQITSLIFSCADEGRKGVVPSVWIESLLVGRRTARFYSLEEY